MSHSSMSKKKMIEHTLEKGLFLSRWLMAPFYVGLVGALAMLLFVFVHELANSIPLLYKAGPEEVILTVLDLIDLSLAGNLVLIVIFSGYENFVSKINTENAEDRPGWMGTLDFSADKKLSGSLASIRAAEPSIDSTGGIPSKETKSHTLRSRTPATFNSSAIKKAVPPRHTPHSTNSPGMFRARQT